jgi:hypothetical protein
LELVAIARLGPDDDELFGIPLLWLAVELIRAQPTNATVDAKNMRLSIPFLSKRLAPVLIWVLCRDGERMTMAIATAGPPATPLSQIV